MILKNQNDFNSLRTMEWLETNGIGGYASGTLSGAHSRRYHGLLVASTHPPVGRMVLLSKLDETVVVDGASVELGSNQYPGAVHPAGHEHLVSFERDLFPEFVYKVGKIELKKKIVSVHGENTILVVYEVTKAPKKFILELLPLYAARDFHSLAHANDSIHREYTFENNVFRTRNYNDVPELFISVPGSTFTEDHHWYHNFEYSVEKERGLNFSEDLYTHGRFSVDLGKGDTLIVIVSTENPVGRDAKELLENETARRKSLIKNFSWNKRIEELVLAADQFVVKRGDGNTIIAGYPWFSDWGRDTMIALPGLTLVTGRYDDARRILRKFAESASEGMLPNRFPDQGETPEYNTIDATLWFFHAIYKYYQYTKDFEFVRELLPALTDIIHWHDRGTRYGIQVDPSDGLLSGGKDGVQLTWMDAKVGDWVVTPRRGKAVEINAHWYNALRAMEFFLAKDDRKEEAEDYEQRAAQVAKSFNDQFWNAEKGYLFDYILGDHRNDDFRPNQIFALSLSFPLLDNAKTESVFDNLTEKLLTPKGLRSLSPDHADYKPFYGGGVWQRDGAYHQGTVWSFLMGPYIDALMKLRSDKGKSEAVQILNTFFNHLDEAGIGSVSEIFDGVSPHTSRGCFAQAWGVAEILRVSVEHKLFSNPAKKTNSK